MGIFAKKWGKKEIRVNDALLQMEKAALEMARIAGNDVTTDICVKRMTILNERNRILKKGLA